MVLWRRLRALETISISASIYALMSTDEASDDDAGCWLTRLVGERRPVIRRCFAARFEGEVPTLPGDFNASGFLSWKRFFWFCYADAGCLIGDAYTGVDYCLGELNF